ncbi:MAG: hypothetical protein LH491_04350 [Pseudoxanthomonas sp.]|nr:hypothetical protein [Pseudoxanthomonas sp.]
MSNPIRNTATLFIGTVMVLALAGCNVEKTQEGEMPEVEITTKGGELPAYEVETAEVKLENKTVTVEVPTATVEMPNDPDNKVTDETDSSKK